MQTGADSAWFDRHLRTALTSLYDPSVLRNSPLTELFGTGERGDAVSTLRRILTDAIESLRPNESTPPGSRTWRLYQVLRRRYTEQLTQRKVAADLGLSIRQLQREEKLARRVLADRLWRAHDLGTRADDVRSVSPQNEDQSPLADAQIPTRAQELEYLSSSVAARMTHVEEVIEEVLETVHPLLQTLRVTVDYTTEEMPNIFLQEPMLRQALLNVVSTALHCVPRGQVRIQTQVLPQQVGIRIRAIPHPDVPLAKRDSCAESLDMAEQLVHLCRGSLEAAWSAEGEGAFAARILLPIAEQVTVLAIDDNADTLQLFRRYLSGSHYRFIGAQDAQKGFALAEGSGPQIIVLDVMMPEQDGWALLGRLREHPRTRGIPIIVCTILSQEELALALGAAEFIRKPVGRTELLSALDRQLDLLTRESR